MTEVEMSLDRVVPGRDPDVLASDGRATGDHGAAAAIRVVAAVLALMVSLGSSAIAQPPRRGESAARDPLASTKAKLQAEASKVDRLEVSPLFSSITGPTPDSNLRLREEQIQLCRRFELLARDIVKGWLLRGLDSDTPPEMGQLESRLTDRGVKLREAVFAHVEAMSLDGILEPDQASAWYKKSRTKPKPRLPSRSEPQLRPPLTENDTAESLARALRITSGDLRRSGLIFDFILGSPWIDSVYPKGFENLDPAKQQELMKERDLPQVVLSAEQAILARRLDGLTREVLAAWLVRGLDDQPPPSRDTLSRRWQALDLTFNALQTRAEVLALEAILTPEQSDRIFAVLWTRMGTTCLLDPAMAARLKLTRGQRDEARALIDNKYERMKEIGAASLPLVAQIAENPEAIDLLRAMDPVVNNTRDQADAAILGVLTRSQMRTMKRLLAPAAERDPAKPDATK